MEKTPPQVKFPPMWKCCGKHPSRRGKGSDFSLGRSDLVPQDSPRPAAYMRFFQKRSQLNHKTRVGIVPKRRELSKRNSAELIASLHTRFTVFPQGVSHDELYTEGRGPRLSKVRAPTTSALDGEIIGEGAVLNAFTKLRIAKLRAMVVHRTGRISTVCPVGMPVEICFLHQKKR